MVDELVPEFVKTPSSEQEWLEISTKFETRWNYPYALGAIDNLENLAMPALIIITSSTRIQ